VRLPASSMLHARFALPEPHACSNDAACRERVLAARSLAHVLQRSHLLLCFSSLTCCSAPLLLCSSAPVVPLAALLQLPHLRACSSALPRALAPAVPLAALLQWSCLLLPCFSGLACCCLAPVVLPAAALLQWSCLLLPCSSGLACCCLAPVVLPAAALLQWSYMLLWRLSCRPQSWSRASSVSPLASTSASTRTR